MSGKIITRVRARAEQAKARRQKFVQRPYDALRQQSFIYGNGPVCIHDQLNSWRKAFAEQAKVNGFPKSAGSDPWWRLW